MRRASLLVLAFGVGACFVPGSLTDEMPEDLPAGSCEDTDTDACDSSSGSTEAGSSSGGETPTTASVVDECEGTQACLGEGACVADWDTQSQSRGPFTCQFTCVPLLDETAWCGDDAACCEASAQCTPRGYCVLPESDDAGSVGSSGGSST